MPPLPQRLVRALVGSPASTEMVTCRRGDRELRFELPGNERWITVKDNLLLREYEWLGCDLEDTHGLVVDAGAHLGTFAVMASLYAESVVALEPNPAVLPLLRANLARNGSDNAEVVEAALWVDGDGGRLETSEQSSAATLERGLDEAGGVRTLDVATTTLGELVDRHGDIDLLKIDIEGAEFPVFDEVSDETLSRIRRVVGEIHVHVEDDAALRERLVSAGFEVTLRRSPFFYGREGLGLLVRNWRSVPGQLRLKATILGTYSLAALLDPITGVRERVAGVDLHFLYAEKPRQPSARGH